MRRAERFLRSTCSSYIVISTLAAIAGGKSMKLFENKIHHPVSGIENMGSLFNFIMQAYETADFTYNQTLTTKVVASTNEDNMTYVTSEQVKEIAIALRNITVRHENQVKQASSNNNWGPKAFRQLKLLSYCVAVLNDHIKSLTSARDFKNLLIFPGTKWCGKGNVSEHKNDLGPLRGTDQCCRDHDHAVEFIEPRSKKYGIVNTRLWPMMNCADDQKFYDCLLDDDSDSNLMSACVGTIYFNALGAQCFKQTYTVTCVKYERRLLHERTCRKFKIDASKPTWKLSHAKDFLGAYLVKY
ncbi:uncharacterized protein [Dermacentor albipictus]|uniref:uncharacterized protein isoform X1 n=2 Tax=Dermacentor albipictus TaxID=60249 RepID=UPI0031FBD24B